jgi:hypothetical protein
MKMQEIISEQMDLGEIGQLERMDLKSAKEHALAMLKREVRSNIDRRLDLQNQINGAGSTRTLIKLMSDVYFSQQGMSMGASPVMTRKGHGYPR